MSEIERVPWSELGPEFIAAWGRDEKGQQRAEHIEIVGMSGSGKTYFLATILQERMIVRNTPAIIIATKPADSTLQTLGWPIVEKARELSKHRQVIFWPQTKAVGTARKQYQNEQIYNLLTGLWHADSNIIIAFDEIAYAESLSPEMRDVIEMYWREARSQGISIIGMKQRPQGANRHMSSETMWTIAYPPKDHQDMERFAELFGNRRQWIKVLESMDASKREFLIRNSVTSDAYISWVDLPLRPINPDDDNKLQTYLGLKKEHE